MLTLKGWVTGGKEIARENEQKREARVNRGIHASRLHFYEVTFDGAGGSNLVSSKVVCATASRLKVLIPTKEISL